MNARIGAIFLAMAFGIATRSSAPARVGAPASLSALDLIELEIAYTTLMARYYEPIAPRSLVDGARTGIAAELVARGVSSDRLPYTPARVTFGDGEDAIGALVLGTLARYGSRLDGHALVVAAIGGELAALRDPYSVIFRPQAFKRFNAFLGKAAFGGIGAIVSFDRATGQAPIERTLPNSPAAKAGLRGGDAIVAIDGRGVASLANAQALLAALRGKIGTPVKLDVTRSDGSHAQITLARAAVRDPEVETKRFGNVAYLRLTRFGDDAGTEVRSAVAAAERDGARAFALDLRGNGGGYGDEATKVAEVFIGAGPIFTTRERTGTAVVARAAGDALVHEPLAVLVDGDTASASEIVAGAIQDDGVGTLVGTRTFGKGLVQSVFPLPDGSAVKLTTARYTTPKGRDIDRVGIEPDHVVPEPAGALRGDPATDPQLAAALATLDAVAPQPVPSGS